MKDLLLDYLFGNIKLHYMECGFSEQEAEAMGWIAEQKAKGKFVGATSGLFLAIAWGHWHDIILKYVGFSFNRKITQLGIIMGSILFWDNIFTGRRKGANELFGNNLLLNNNLFCANIDSLVNNFRVFELKFSEKQVKALNYKQKLVRTNHQNLNNKKWVYNPAIHTRDEFFERLLSVKTSPWGQENGPSNMRHIIDETGQKFGIIKDFKFGWSQIH